ncbi:larval cuticle protein 65Ag1-like [Diachasma alloeum]|uniref:larval cuticle protein 65Ag1-like n=1 Tax=Diachasma alloeum TaxID=454923 RepID=UPI0010FBB966|nr:larval cuticle protein 65Ag1-like [Diachasma alloeum]
MKMIIAFVALVAVASAAPQSNVYAIRESLHDNIGLPLGYQYGFELSDGSTKQEQARFSPGIDEEGKPADVISVQGSYSFAGDDGQVYTVEYTADENGFQPRGAHLPV